MFTTLVYRTDLITDPDILAGVDAALAASVVRWPSMTRPRLSGQIDKVVANADPDALRRRTTCQRDREIWIGDHVESGISRIEGTVMTPSMVLTKTGAPHGT